MRFQLADFVVDLLTGSRGGALHEESAGHGSGRYTAKLALLRAIADDQRALHDVAFSLLRQHYQLHAVWQRDLEGPLVDVFRRGVEHFPFRLDGFALVILQHRGNFRCIPDLAAVRFLRGNEHAHGPVRFLQVRLRHADHIVELRVLHAVAIDVNHPPIALRLELAQQHTNLFGVRHHEVQLGEHLRLGAVELILRGRLFGEIFHCIQQEILHFLDRLVLLKARPEHQIARVSHVALVGKNHRRLLVIDQALVEPT